MKILYKLNYKNRSSDLIKEICSLQNMIVIRGNVRANHVHVLVSAPITSKDSSIFKRKIISLPEFPALKKRYWKSHLWGMGYFCSTVGATR